MLLPEDIFRFALCALLLGFTAMVGLRSLDVWRRRTAVAAGRKPRQLTAAERLALIFGAAGALSMVGSIAFRLAIYREGAVVTQGVQTVRVPIGYELVDVASGAEVAKGDVVARFRVLLPDGELSLVRQEQNQIGERRHVEYAMTQITTERDRAERDELNARLQRSELLTRLESEVARLRGELLQAKTRRDVAAGQLDAARKLLEQQMIAAQEVVEKEAALRLQQAEVQKSEAALRSVEQQKRAADEIERRVEELQTAQARARELEVRDMAERRAEAAKRERLAGSAAERRETERYVEVRTPVAGSIVYRAPSPSTVFGPDPVIVISPPDGFRVRLRLPSREVEHLRSAGEVDLDLIGKQFIERRFSGQLVASHPIAGESSWSVVELAGLPPEDGVRDAVGQRTGKTPEDSVVRVALKWSPPFFHLPLFRTGLVLAAIAAAILAFATRASRQPQVDVT